VPALRLAGSPPKFLSAQRNLPNIEIVFDDFTASLPSIRSRLRRGRARLHASPVAPRFRHCIDDNRAPVGL
jgi:hypothetical protein